MAIRAFDFNYLRQFCPFTAVTRVQIPSGTPTNKELPQNHRLSSVGVCIPGDQRQSSEAGYAQAWRHAKSDSAVCVCNGTSFFDASVFGAPSTIATTDLRTWRINCSKSTSSQRSRYIAV